MPIITTTELKDHLGIGDTIDDSTLATAVSSACEMIASWCGNGGFDKTASGSETARVFIPESPYLCIVDDFWSTTNLVVKTDDNDDGTYETTWTITTDFVLEPFNGRRGGQTWPYFRVVACGDRTFPQLVSGRAAVQVTAAWGWSSYPSSVKQAALVQAARLWKRKDSPEGVVGGFDQFGAVRVGTRVDPDVEQLLGPYRRAAALGVY